MAKLFYVIGPSGAGKDSVLDYARQHATASLPASFAHRYITRVAESGNETMWPWQSMSSTPVLTEVFLP